MKILEKLQDLLAYYEATRRVGHTTLMKKGIENYDKEKFVLTYSIDAGECIGIKRDEIISWQRLDKLRGHNKPLAIDNGTMFVILNEVTDTIKALQDENEMLREERRKIYYMVSKNI